MNYGQSLHCVLRDLMHFYQMDFKKSLDCINNHRFPVNDYCKCRKYEDHYRKDILTDLMRNWASNSKYNQKKKYNQIVTRCNRGFDILNHTDDPKKQQNYIDALMRLVQDHQILVEQLGIDRASECVTLPYILVEAERAGVL